MLNKIRHARLERGLKQKDLAKRARIHQPTLSALETGKLEASPELAKRIGKALSVPADWILAK